MCGKNSNSGCSPQTLYLSLSPPHKTGGTKAWPPCRSTPHSVRSSWAQVCRYSRWAPSRSCGKKKSLKPRVAKSSIRKTLQSAPPENINTHKVDNRLKIETQPCILINTFMHNCAMRPQVTHGAEKERKLAKLCFEKCHLFFWTLGVIWAKKMTLLFLWGLRVTSWDRKPTLMTSNMWLARRVHADYDAITPFKSPSTLYPRHDPNAYSAGVDFRGPGFASDRTHLLGERGAIQHRHVGEVGNERRPGWCHPVAAMTAQKRIRQNYSRILLAWNEVTNGRGVIDFSRGRLFAARGSATVCPPKTMLKTF